MTEKTSYPESFKVEETVNDYAEDDAQSTTNEFGHGNGNFMTAFFNVTCVVAGTGTLGLPKRYITETIWLRSMKTNSLMTVLHLVAGLVFSLCCCLI
jgi:hypothetical protein